MRILAAASIIISLASAGASGCGSVEDADEGGTPSAGTVEQEVKGHLCPSGATVQGIDVSIYQGSINWSAVRSSGRMFAITRISDGLNHPDSTFTTNWAGIKAAGMIRGAYQFFEPGQDAVAQANMVIARVGRLGPGDLPVMLDAEVTGGQSPATITAQIHRWVNAVKAGTGKTPLVYTGAFFWDDHVKSADFAGLPLVIAWYGTSCPGIPNAWSGWTMHQYTSSARVPGISGNVDADVFNGPLSALQALAGGGSGGGGAPDCSVHTDGKLYCANKAGVAMFAQPAASSAVVNHLRTAYSWFDCWGSGERHAGGNTTWYHTVGDDNANAGWVPGVNLSTPDSFDANPTARGLRQCGGTTTPDTCSVHGDHKLYCENTSGAALHATLSTSGAVVNHLRTTFSWFDCWGTGERHAGGNTTWYHTLGDDNASWGWVPAVDLRTSSAFDANPGAQDLPRCGAPPVMTASCSVHTDGRLYCTNKSDVAMFAGTSAVTTVVNHLRTASSWFDCWGTGDLHAGGNTTWYHTLGDDNGNWGWVPAVHVNTPSEFDANPIAGGLGHCN